MGNKNKYIRVRASEVLYRSVYKKAQSLGMSMSEYIRFVLTKELEAKPLSAKISGNDILFRSEVEKD